MAGILYLLSMVFIILIAITGIIILLLAIIVVVILEFTDYLSIRLRS